MLRTCGAISKDGGVEAVNYARDEKLACPLIDVLLLTCNATTHTHTRTRTHTHIHTNTQYLVNHISTLLLYRPTACYHI